MAANLTQDTTASAVESARILKATLRAAYPKTAFSVTLSRGTGYGYCHVKWTDGPTAEKVEAITGPFQGSRFDGMTDCEESLRNTLPDGRRTGLRGVATERQISPTFARRLLSQIATYFGAPAVPVVLDRVGYDGKPRWELADHNAMIDGEYWSTWLCRASGDATRFALSGGR